MRVCVGFDVLDEECCCDNYVSRLEDVTGDRIGEAGSLFVHMNTRYEDRTTPFTVNGGRARRDVFQERERWRCRVCETPRPLAECCLERGRPRGSSRAILDAPFRSAATDIPFTCTVCVPSVTIWSV